MPGFSGRVEAGEPVGIEGKEGTKISFFKFKTLAYPIE